MKKTLPGSPARGTRTGRPVMVLLDLLGRKQSLRILWELKDGPMTFRALQTSCDDISPTVLNSRLTELRDALIVTHTTGTGYELTALGRELSNLLAPLNAWSNKWSKTLQ